MPPNVDEARQRIRAAIANRPIAIAPEALDEAIEQAAAQLASGVSPEQPKTKYYRVASMGQSRRRKPAAAARAKPASGKPPWLLVDDEPISQHRDLEVHFSRGDSGVKVTISKRAADEIVGYATRRGGHTEEGGLLLGRRTSFHGEITVSDAGGPGPNSRRTEGSYKPDHLHDLLLHQGLKNWRADPDLCEVGVWHLHCELGSHARPSAGDLQFFAGMQKLLDHSPGYVGVILAPRETGFAATAWITTVGDRLARDPWFKTQPAELIVEGQSWSAS